MRSRSLVIAVLLGASVLASEANASAVPDELQVPARVASAWADLSEDFDGDLVAEANADGEVRVLARHDGPLAEAGEGSSQAIARQFVERERAALGLDADDLGGLELAGVSPGVAGGRIVRFVQSANGVPSLEGQLEVAVTRAGGVLRVSGTAEPDLSELTETEPSVSREQAFAAVVKDDEATPFTAEKVISTALGAPRLAWHVVVVGNEIARRGIVDAETGSLLQEDDLLDHAADARIYRDYPGAPGAGDAETVDLEALGYLSPGASELSGPYVDQYADVNGSFWEHFGDPLDPSLGEDPGEETPRTPDGDFVYPLTPVDSPRGECAPLDCTWNHLEPSSWQPNRLQAATQAFWLFNNFHDHLKASPINFDEASGNFENEDKLFALTQSEAANEFVPTNNASMFTPPDGQPPVMVSYLFSAEAPDWEEPGSFVPTGFRDVDSANAAEIMYHEYTHGLSNRLVTDARGWGALASFGGGSIGEALSDWYALDYLVADGGRADDHDVDGDLKMGEYVDAPGQSTRVASIDCPVASTASRCEGTERTGPGGFTFADWPALIVGQGVHAGGLVIGQTLWDLRSALEVELGSDEAGSEAAERLITDALRLAPPNPEFLDLRDAILQADAAAGGRFHDLIWDVFAERGMGHLAHYDLPARALPIELGDPIEDFSVPPRPGEPIGVLRGRIVSGDTGQPIAGVRVGAFGHLSDPALSTETDRKGKFKLKLPARVYPSVVIDSPQGHELRFVEDVEITEGESTHLNAAIRRDWVATAGGAEIVEQKWGTFSGSGERAIDRRPSIAWQGAMRDFMSGEVDPSITVKLPAVIDVDRYVLHQRTFGEVAIPDTTLLTKDYRIETSADGQTFTTSAEGELEGTPGLRTEVPAGAGAAGVRYVRISLLDSQDSSHPSLLGYFLVHLGEFEVFGNGG